MASWCSRCARSWVRSFFRALMMAASTGACRQTTGLRSPESCTCLRALPGTDDLLLCWIDSTYDPTHHHFGVRTPLALALSQDRGQSWARLGNVAHRDEFNFFDIGCDFVDDETAIMTYGFYGPNDYENNLPDQ